ncbi:LysE family translocator [Acetobacter cibinongensis]|uniref:Amino acid transporter n=1 Tax=Acetobacter cibinongensis TaxID=146475 RepID=A0A1Z5YVN3_9PROT|nr:LysE family translocator [Acetobacter cibinongensis]OUJ03032.1 amino acid transporter [Acetobacter cibinongensis]GAN60599.1 lysine/threonine exporter LysE/YggA [Acetobacter cibinongensis]GBQ14528.1 lysine/threonine exporter protein LysE [Acetobacter cibinongensis NRIC 0482]GEL59789.1 amino acid transporter [Acetobacter cibinongensis]
MTLHTWWLFIAAVFLLSGTPGPNMLHILSRSVDFGMKRSIAAMAGCLTALVTVLAASALGLTTLLMTLPGVFEILRYVGVAYLLYLGIKAWRSDVAALDVGEDKLSTSLPATTLFRGGFIIGISNPKLILFATAFLPQFVSPSAAQAPQFAILVASFAAVECFWYVIYAAGGRSLSHYLIRPSIKRVFNRITGAIFVGFAALLLRSRPA